MAIRMPPMHTTLVEVHQELAKTFLQAKEIAEVCKHTTKVSKYMHKGCSAASQANEEFTTRLQQVEFKLQVVEERPFKHTNMKSHMYLTSSLSELVY